MENPWRRLMGPNFWLALGVIFLFSLAILHPGGKAAAFVAGLQAAGLIWLLSMPLAWSVTLPLAARMRDTRHGFGPCVLLHAGAATGAHRVTGRGPWIFWLLTGLWV